MLVCSNINFLSVTESKNVNQFWLNKILANSIQGPQPEFCAVRYVLCKIP